MEVLGLRSISTSSRSCQLEASFRNIVDEMSKDVVEFDEATNLLQNLDADDLMAAWSENAEEEKKNLRRKLQEIYSRENRLFPKIVENVATLEKVVGVDNATGFEGRKEQVDSMSFDDECESWSRLQGVVEPEWSPDDREREFARLSTDWLALWTIVRHHTGKLL